MVELVTEEKESNGSYSEELNEIIDSFGYEWRWNRRYIILDPLKKNLKSFQVEKAMDAIMSFVPKSKDPKINQRIEQIYGKSFTSAKIPAIKEIFADVVIIAVFSMILWGFAFRINNLLGLLSALVAIVLVFASLFHSIHVLFLSDEEYLKSRFGFTREGSTLKADGYNIAKKKQNELARNVFFSSVFILLAILPIVYNYPALVFVNTFLNLIAFLLVIFVFIIQFLRNIFVKKDSKTAQQKLTTALLSLIFFVVYAFGLLSGQAEINRVIGYAIDLMVVYGVVLFIRDIGKTRNYRAWVDDNWRKTSNETQEEPSPR